MMKETFKVYRAICFDLDGTLLPMDIEEFMNAYFKRIATFMAGNGLDVDLFKKGLYAGIKAMADHPLSTTNEVAFWSEYFKVCGIFDEEIQKQHRSLADEFYEKDFYHIGDDLEVSPIIPATVKKLKDKGYPLVLTTMPMFPKRAVEHRLAWAGLKPSDFLRITSYENSSSAKPNLDYYAENLCAMGICGEDVLMVGNNTLEDLDFMKLGADAYLVTDQLLDPIGFDINSVKHGSFEDFANWVDGLAECMNPISSVYTGVVHEAKVQLALQENLKG